MAATSSRATCPRLSGPLPHGRASPTSTSTSGYSQTMLKMTGASRAVNAPPTTPPTDNNR